MNVLPKRYTRKKLWEILQKLLDEHTCCMIQYNGKLALMSKDAMDLFGCLLAELKNARATDTRIEVSK